MQLVRLHLTLLLLLSVELCLCLLAPCMTVIELLTMPAGCGHKQGAELGERLKGNCSVGEVDAGFV